MMESILMLLVNVGIAFWNARVAGCCWRAAKEIGGFFRIIIWCAVIQSAVGFSLLYVAIVCAVCATFQVLPPVAIEWLVGLVYIFLYVAAVGSGLLITIYSWWQLIKYRSFGDAVSAGWNTYAAISNLSAGLDGLNWALDSVGDLFDRLLDGDDSDDDSVSLFIILLVIALAILVLAGGVLTAFGITKHYAMKEIELAIARTTIER